MRANRMSMAVGGWITVGILALAPVALTGDASSEPVSDSVSTTRWVSVSTGLMTFRPGRALRVSAVEVDGSRPAREVRLFVIDGKRRVLRQTVEQLTPNAPVFLDLARNEIPPGSDPPGLPIRAEYKLPCPDDDPGPVTSFEIYNTATSETEVSSACGCPCCPRGPTVPPPVQVDCGGGYRVGQLTSAP
ncbi:MAG TPA: hypothetical protein VK698_26465 [Kofleriaceae bacterium]|nr:hypothetical protein [Kofleriaceae bacterium]